MILAVCSGFTVAGVCYSCNMRGINFYGSLESFNKSIGMTSGLVSNPPPPPPSYPEGFTAGPFGGFTLGPSVPKTPPTVRPKYSNAT